MNTTNNGPCLDCGERTPECHAKCEKYAKYVNLRRQSSNKSEIKGYIGDCIYKRGNYVRSGRR